MAHEKFWPSSSDRFFSLSNYNDLSSIFVAKAKGLIRFSSTNFQPKVKPPAFWVRRCVPPFSLSSESAPLPIGTFHAFTHMHVKQSRSPVVHHMHIRHIQLIFQCVSDSVWMDACVPVFNGSAQFSHENQLISMVSRQERNCVENVIVKLFNRTKAIESIKWSTNTQRISASNAQTAEWNGMKLRISVENV